MHLVLRILYVFEGEPAPFEEKKPAVESMSLPLLFCNGINVIVFLLYNLFQRLTAQHLRKIK